MKRFTTPRQATRESIDVLARSRRASRRLRRRAIPP